MRISEKWILASCAWPGSSRSIVGSICLQLLCHPVLTPQQRCQTWLSINRCAAWADVPECCAVTAQLHPAASRYAFPLNMYHSIAPWLDIWSLCGLSANGVGCSGWLPPQSLCSSPNSLHTRSNHVEVLECEVACSLFWSNVQFVTAT